MEKGKRRKGVLVMTLTSQVWFRNTRRTYMSRVGACGDFSVDGLKKMKEDFRKLYDNQIKNEYKDVPEPPHKVVTRCSMRFTDCDVVIRGEE